MSCSRTQHSDAGEAGIRAVNVTNYLNEPHQDLLFPCQLRLLLPVDNLCKQFGPRSGPTKCQSWSGSKLFDTLIVFLKDFLFKSADDHKSMKNYPACKELRQILLAQRIRICEILACVRNSYLTHVMLLSYPGCHERTVHWLYWNSRRWSTRDVIVQSNWPHHVIMHLSIFRDFWKLIFLLEAYFKISTQWWVRKRIHYLCEGGIKKSITSDHSLSSLSNWWSLRQIF